jgi:hypothetical protein
MIIEDVPLAETRAPERNVRRHPERQIAELARAVEMFGQTRPIVIDEDGTVLVGNGLVAAFRQLGRATIQAYRMTNLTPDAKRKLMLADNRLYDLGVDDYDGILTTIRSLTDFDIPGFDADMLQRLTAQTQDVTAAAQGFTVAPPQIAQAQQREIPPGSTTPAPAAPAPTRTCSSCGAVLPP